ncbi:uncharacterized protein LOC119647782 [Hermetia illucens]|uniref:uncharacterized protein LOC119647782 n=1 Tax=Hermetia illucens TaxID=343691 RepID=UPI0018CC34A7|nr:uncharacterized protein LOC119647782 [Hermetia illucens]
MFLSIHFFVILVAATYFEPSFARRDFSILFDTCEVPETSKYCDMNCTVSKSHKLTTYLNVLEKASNFGASIQLFAKSLRANDFVKIFDHTFDNICTFMSNSQLGNIFLIILDEAKEFGKVPTCPAEKVRRKFGEQQKCEF